MRKHILIPTDLSEKAWNALNYATALYRNTECTFYLLHANEEEGNEKAREEYKKELIHLVKDQETRFPHRNYSFKTICTNDSFPEAVKKATVAHQISMVVLGTAGDEKAKDILNGKNTIDVLENFIKCPLLVIPIKSDLPEGKLREIVFATTFDFSYQKKELDPILEIAGYYKAIIRVLFVSDKNTLTEDQENNKAILEKLLSDSLYSFHTLNNIKVIPGIYSFIDDRSSNLLVIYNRKQGLFKEHFQTNLLKEIINTPQIPLLVLRER